MQHNLLIQTCLLVASLLAVTATTRADWMNLTGAETAQNIAEVYVLEDHVRVVLEVYLSDLAHFEALVPDQWLEGSDIQRPPLTERLRRFSDTGLQFITESGEKLQAQVKLVEPRLRVDRNSPFAGMLNPTTRRVVPDAPTDKRVLYAELVYPFSGKPQQLTMVPPLDDNGQALVNIGFIVYHKSVPVIDFRYLGAPSRLMLNWDDPWYSRFENPNLKRHHKSALMSFLYVEPYEVRHEILTRVRDLDTWMDLGLRGDEYIEINELEPLKQRIGAFLLGRNPVLIDGEARKPILDRSNYVKVALTGIKLMEKPERLEIDTAIIGVIITYITDGMPQKVTVEWALFNDQVERVPATATDTAGPLPTFLTPEDNIHTWTNYLKNFKLPTVQQIDVAGSLGELRLPLITLLCLAGVLIVAIWTLLHARRRKPLRVPLVAAALLLATGAVAYPFASITITRPTVMAGEIDDERAEALLQTLLKNVYRSFDFREEEDVYDKLALSVSGDLLTEIYLHNRRSMAIQQAGGAQAKIKEVAVEQVSAERIDGDGLSYALHGRWTALGRVGHWGHVHQRKNRYEAVITISAQEGVWKITGLELMDEQRIDQSSQAGVGKASAEAASTPLSGTQ